MPAESEEIWRYSGIDDFELARFAPVGTGGAPATRSGSLLDALASARATADRIGPRSLLVVTLDGSVVAIEAGAGAVEGLSVSVASPTLAGAPDQAATSPGSLLDAGEWVEEALGSVAGVDDAFGALHDTFLADVVALHLVSGADVADPVVVAHLVDPAPVGGLGPSAFPRTVVRLGAGARGTVVELTVSWPGDGMSAGEGSAPGALVVPVTELDVADGAYLAYANVQVLDLASTQIALQASRVARDGELRSFAVVAGGRYARLRTDAAAVGTGAHSALLAAFLGVEDQVLDFRTRQEHIAAHTTSELLFKGAVADTARSVYSGLIQIRPGARKTSAVQTNHNLVLSEGARADSVPNLDIEENDVRCSHASTVGPVDEEQRYYLESRGIEPPVAERLVVAGFFADLAARCPVPGVGRWLQEIAGERLTASRLVGSGADRG
jgi:Fe-S cluster assembly protein SufD